MSDTETFMSANAKRAFERGLFTLETLSSEFLEQRRFGYSVEFARWLCKERYLFPSEAHHAFTRQHLTDFYHPKSIDYACICLDLKSLYEIYSGRETVEAVVHKKGVAFARVIVTGRLLGLKTKPVTLDCVAHRGILFWSQKTVVFCDGSESRIVGRWDSCPADWKNPNTPAIFKMIAANKKASWQYTVGEPG